MYVLRRKQTGTWRKHVPKWQGTESPAGISGFLAINDQCPFGLFPEVQIILKIDVCLDSVIDIALLRDEYPSSEILKSWIGFGCSHSRDISWKFPPYLPDSLCFILGWCSNSG
jgi:hypothetical protein